MRQDNLPHDKVVRDSDGRVWECHVVTDASGAMREESRPLADPVLRRCLDILGAALFDPAQRSARDVVQAWLGRALRLGDGNTDVAYVPTAAMQLLERIAAVAPAPAAVVLADFDALPHALPGRLGPTVQRRVSGSTVTSDTYLVPPGTCDIMFPTDFNLLRLLHQHALGCGSTVWKQRDFMRAHALHDGARTRDGFNPLLDDYANVSILATAV